MATKIYIESNYLILEDTVSGSIQQSPKANVEYRVSGSEYWFFNTDLESYLNKSGSIPFSSIQDQSGSAYASQTVFNTFLRGNTGLSLGSGQIAYSEPMTSGQKTSYRNRDEYWRLLNGFLDPINPSNPAYVQELDFDAADPYNTLLHPNFWGGYERTTNDLGGTVDDGSDGSTTGYIVDNLINRGTYNTALSGSWNGLLDSSATFTLGSYTANDFFMTTLLELYAIAKAENITLSHLDWGLMANTSTDVFYSSTTRGELTSNSWCYDIDSVSTMIESRSKALTRVCLYTRRHFYV